MIGRVPTLQTRLFYDDFRLNERVRPDHPLRVIRKLVDFDFVSELVKDCYGYNGNVSVPPPVILKLMFLLFYYDVASERELMATLPERLDWLWFLDYDLDAPLPDHSVLSKARRRWGVAVFHELFMRVVEQCVALGLVDGERVYCDASLVDANAANDSIRRTGRFPILGGKLEPRLSDTGESNVGKPDRKSESGISTEGDSKSEIRRVDESGCKNKRQSASESKGKRKGKDKDKGKNKTASETAGENRGNGGDESKGESGDASEEEGESAHRWVSTTDPDAAVVKGRGGARARFKTNRMIDDRHGVITATQLTPGDVNEAHLLPALLDEHQALTRKQVKTATADSKYGTIENYLHCHDRKVAAYMPDLKRATAESGRKRGMFPDTEFRYCPAEDEYVCPAGQRLKRKRWHEARQAYDYFGTAAMCGKCRLRERCTSGQNGRSIKRHIRQDDIDRMRKEAMSWQAVAARRRRQSLMEGSFGDGANNHGLKRSRWRGLERASIQDYLIAAVQNIRIMIKRRLRWAEDGAGARATVNRAGTLPPMASTRLLCALFRIVSGALRAKPIGIAFSPAYSR